MNHRPILAGSFAILLAGAPSAMNQNADMQPAGAGDIKIVVNHNGNDAATPAFKFEKVPPPSKIDAAQTARFTITDGETDPNSATTDALHDGEVPAEEDEPSASFFFRSGTAGGSIVVDLGGAIEIKEIRTYSWHPGSRGPQVYKLFASDGRADNFNPKPGQDVAPETCGWKAVANVDTRPKTGGGGQYGVDISSTAGMIGSYRYLLFECSRTEADDAFGNTFYSEIDVVDVRAPAVPAETAIQIAPVEPFTVESADGKCKITINVGAAPELRDWATQKLAPVLAEWYPKIAALLPSEGFTAPNHFTVTIRPGRGVAATGGTRITANSTWLKREIKGEAVGSLVHEMVHVVQQYGRARNNPEATRSPGWLVEGIADYVRWFKYEPESHGADIIWMRKLRNFSPRYDAGYRVTANFLDWTAKKYDPQIVTRLNAAMREGKYSDELWKQAAGKLLQELGEEWKREIAAQLAGGSEAGATAKTAPQ